MSSGELSGAHGDAEKARPRTPLTNQHAIRHDGGIGARTGLQADQEPKPAN